MSIVAQCPHCETRFTLQPDMNGKSMRCPNLECRQVFAVRAMAATAPPPEPPAPKPAPPRPAAPPKPAPPAARKPAKPVRAAEAEPEVVEGAIVDAAVVAPQVKEVVWSEGTDVPPPPPPKKTKKAAKATDPDPDFIVKRKKKSNRGPLILIGMAVAVVALVVFAAFYVISQRGRNEEQLAAEAKKQYDAGDYTGAAKSYEKLAADFGGGGKADGYKFFADLASMQTAVRSVTNREDYAPAVARLRAFIDAYKDSPLAKPTGTGYGRDVLEAGKKLAEDVAAHAGDRVKAYQADRAKSGELARADAAIAKGRELLPVLDPFRGPDDQPLDKYRALFDQVEKDVRRERDRAAAVARAREQLDTPTDVVIQAVEADLKTAGLLDDAEAQGLLSDARARQLRLVKYEDRPAAPQAPPPTAAASLLFVTPVGKTRPRTAAAGEAGPAAFLCVARGILYALDEDTGNLLWAARVGADVTDPPAVAQVTLAGTPTDVAVVTSNVGGAPAVAGHALRSGNLLWYQPLTAPAAGPAVVVGARAFVPLRDPDGTVLEFDLVSGQQVGLIRFGQPLAEKGAVLRPGTNLVYLTAEARRVYVLDAGGRDDDGNRVTPRCAQALATGHLAGTVRVPPLFVGPEGAEPADRWMVLAQAAGPAVTQLRAFPVGPVPPPAADGAVPEAAPTAVAAPAVPGWVWFPPVCDGERLAVASDAGQLRVFGVNQAGNLDKPLFPLAAPALPAPADDRPVRGLVIPAEESAYWLLAGGTLQRARVELIPSRGQEVVFADATPNVGEPVHRAQLGARRDAACLTVRSPNSSGCRAVLFDLKTGEVRWQRQLGLVPAKVSTTEQPAAPVRQGESLVLVDEDGGVVAVPAAAGVAAGQTLAAPAGWVAASAPANATGPTLVATSADGRLLFATTPVAGRDGRKFVVRRVADGKLVGEDEVAAPEALAGQPAVVGGALHLPTADGFVSRFVPGAGVTAPAALVAGPKWRGDRAAPGAVCAITPLTESTFLTADGGKSLARWEWGPGANANRKEAGTWSLSEAVAGAGLALPAEEGGAAPRVLVADASGSVRLYAADKPGPPLRRWKAGALPAGKVTSGFAVQPGEGNKVAVAFVVDGRFVVALDPDRDEVLWATKLGDDAAATAVGAPQPAAGNRWVVTDLAGRVRVLDGATGEATEAAAASLPGAVPSAAAGVNGPAVLSPLSDGSAVVTELKK